MDSSEDSNKYLEDGFDASTLKVSNLRNILVKHKVEYPSNAKKPELLEIFDKKITRKAHKLRRDSSKARKVKGDSRGIQIMKEEEMQPAKNAAGQGQAQGKAKVKGKSKSKGVAKFVEQDSAFAGKSGGTKRKLEELEKTASGDEAVEQGKASRAPGPSGVSGQKKRLINASLRESNASDSSADSDQSAARGGGKGQEKQQPQRKKKKVGATMGSPVAATAGAAGAAAAAAKDAGKARGVVSPGRETNFSSENPFQSGSRPATPDRRRRKGSAAAGGAGAAKSPVTPMSALRKSQVSEVSFRVALPKTASSDKADEDNDVEMQEAADEKQREPMGDAEAGAEEDQARVVQTEAAETLVVQAQADQTPAPAEPEQPGSGSGSGGRPPKFDLNSLPEQQAFRPVVHSPQRFSMTPDGLRQLASAQSDRQQQRLEQLFPAAQQQQQQAPVSIGKSGGRASKRQVSGSMLPPVAPNISASTNAAAAAAGGDADEIQTLQRRRIATLRQHVEGSAAAAGDREHRGHSRRSSIASIADSVGEARGIPAVPAAAAAAESESGSEGATQSSAAGQRTRKPGSSSSSSFMRKLALCALLGLAAVGWRTHEQFQTGFGNTRAENAHLPPPATSSLVEPAAIDFASAPLAERVRYLVQLARARYVQPRPLDCPEHATCVAYAPIPAESASQEAVLQGASRDQWLVDVDGRSMPVVRCDPGHVVQFPALSSRVLPMLPECVRDLSTEHRVRQLADAMVRICSARRGQAQCDQSFYEQAREYLSRQAPAAEHEETTDEADEVERLGVSVGELRQAMAERKSPHLTNEEFDSVFRLAVDELMNKRTDSVAGFVLEVEDEEGSETTETTYFVSRRPEYPPLCRLRRLALGVLLGNLRTVLSTVGLGVVAMIGSRRYAGYRAEVRAADALVLSALERLKRQARRHYVDPAISPSPAIPSLQLRDLLLLSSASPSSTPAEGGADSAGGRSGYYDPRARASVWERVRKVVERNANVRCRTTAVRGEPMRVWEWIGPLDDDADDEAAAAFGSPFSSPQRLSSPYPSNIAL